MDKIRDIQLAKLTERAKELKCIYRVMEILHDEQRPLVDIFGDILEAIPIGYQHPTICEAMIIFEGKQYKSRDFQQSPYLQFSNIVIDNHVAGDIQICYSHNIEGTGNPFLPEEQKMLNTIAERLSMFIFFRRLKKTITLMQGEKPSKTKSNGESLLDYESDEHWKWRYHEANRIAAEMDLDLFGVKALYVIGSTKNGNAGPASDIDLLIHHTGNQCKRDALEAWLRGWGLGLSELNFYKTGYQVSGSLVDYHIITDEDIERQTSYAVMIGSTSNSARLLKSK